MKDAFIYGWNQPGYSPELAEGPMPWGEARDSLLWEVERSGEDAFGTNSAQLDRVAEILRTAETSADIEIGCGTWVLFILTAEA